MRPIYLDYNATTPIDLAVVDAIWPYLQTHFGNPNCWNHESNGESADVKPEALLCDDGGSIALEVRSAHRAR